MAPDTGGDGKGAKENEESQDAVDGLSGIFPMSGGNWKNIIGSFQLAILVLLLRRYEQRERPEPDKPPEIARSGDACPWRASRGPGQALESETASCVATFS